MDAQGRFEHARRHRCDRVLLDLVQDRPRTGHSGILRMVAHPGEIQTSALGTGEVLLGGDVLEDRPTDETGQRFRPAHGRGHERPILIADCFEPRSTSCSQKDAAAAFQVSQQADIPRAWSWRHATEPRQAEHWRPEALVQE